MKLLMYLSVPASLTAIAVNQTMAADGSVNITGNQKDDYVATDKVSGSSFDKFTATSKSATFKKDLIGTHKKNVKELNISFEGGTASGDIIGLYLDKDSGNISEKNTINIKGGTIQGDILATSDKGNYKGTLRRESNNINISGGNIGGNIEGGAGAKDNFITITGGTFIASNQNLSNSTNDGDDGDDGDCGDNKKAIYAGVSDASTKNKSENGTVTLKNMSLENSFLKSFVEENNNVSGMIFGSNVTGTSNIKFENVNGTYSGGFKDFNNVNVDSKSGVTLNGKSYYADNWNVDGTLDTNGKTLHTYKNTTLGLTVGSTGTLKNQFISDANVDAKNNGNINGIRSDKNITLNNSGKMKGEYFGTNVNINNSGIINATVGDITSISSQNAGELNNSGQIKETLSVNGNMTINNSSNGNIKATLVNNQNILNINNVGTIDNSSIINSGNKTVNLTNSSGGNINNSLALKGGILSLVNNNGASLTGNSFSTDGGIFNISNSGNMSGVTSLTATNNGSFALINNTNGVISGNLTINSGLSGFENNGLMNNLTVINHQNNITLTNNKNISGTGAITSDTVFALKNKGNISGTQSWKNVDLDNQANGLIQDLALTSSEGGEVNIANAGMMAGANSISSQNGGTLNLINEESGTLSGNLTINSGLSGFENNGLMNNLTVINHQNNITLTNNKNISGTGAITSDTVFALKNKGNISGTQSWKNVNLDNQADGLVQDLALTSSEGGEVNIANAGMMAGNNSLNTLNSGKINLVNKETGAITGKLDIDTTLVSFENDGLFTDLSINNRQNNALQNQTSGIIENTAFITDNANLNINNSGILTGSNSLTAIGNGKFSLTNQSSGKLSGQLLVNSGLNQIENDGQIEDWSLISEISDFVIENNATFSGNNAFITQGSITLNNKGVASGNLSLNGGKSIINHESSSVLSTNFIGMTGMEDLELNNASSSVVMAKLGGNLNSTILRNNNTDINAAKVSITNDAKLNAKLQIKNMGYTAIINNNTISDGITDNLTSVADGDCLKTKLDITNNGMISGNMSVKNSILTFNNNTSGVVTSEHIDTRDLRLNNQGQFKSTSDYLFSVQNNFDVNNSGTIYGGDTVFKLTGDKVSGKITNSGTIWSYGTTIAMDKNKIPCPDCGYDNSLSLFNTGTLISVDPNNLVIPRLDSYAINVPTMNVYNKTGGIIGGSVNVKNYTQEAGSTWVTFMDKDKSQMSTITAQNDISIAPGSVLYIHTNNDILQFTDGQTFQLVNAKGMTEDEVKTQLNNYTLKTDTPFLTYTMTNDDNNGYIVFNKVSPTKYADATDLTTSGHNNIVAASHRLYEIFVNRNRTATASTGMASGDSNEIETHIAFMPFSGHMRQDDDAKHSGYSSDYHGGIAYLEHDFSSSIKGGVGFSYLYSATDYSDAARSSSTVDSYRPFAYVNYEIDNWRFDLTGGWAQHRINNNRRYGFNGNLYVATSKYDVEEISGHFSAGYRFNFDNKVMVQPMAGLFASTLKTDSYSERGIGPMNMHVDAEDYNSVKTMLGVKVKKEYALENGLIMKPEFHIRWYHELADTHGSVGAYFLAQQELFNNQGIESPKDIGDIAFRLTTQSDEQLDIFVEGYYQFGTGFYNVGGTVGLKYNF